MVAFLEQSLETSVTIAPPRYVGAWLRGVDLAAGTILWTIDLTSQLPASPTGLVASGTSNGSDRFGVVVTPDQLPVPDSPDQLSRLMTIDARSGRLLASLAHTGSPWSDSVQFLMYSGHTVVYQAGGLVFGAADTDLATPDWNRSATGFGDPVIDGHVRTADGYANPVTGAPTGLPNVPTQTLTTWYVSQAGRGFRLQNPTPKPDSVGLWQPGPLWLVDAAGQPLWDTPAMIDAQQFAVTNDVVVATCGLKDLCGFNLADGRERWHQPIDQTQATVLGGGGDWAFVRLHQDHPVGDNLLGIRADDGVTVLTVPISGGVDPVWFGQCLVYYATATSSDGTDADQLVARDLRSPDLPVVWSTPAFHDGVLYTFDGVMVLVNSISQPRIRLLKGSH